MALPYGSSNQFKLDNPPSDFIQRVRYNPSDNKNLLAASWDTSVRLYDIPSNKIRVQYHHDGPVLDTTFQTSNRCWSGGCDDNVKVFDFESQDEFTVGSHDGPVRCVEFIQESNLIATASWDKQLKFWDPRAVDSSKEACISTHQLPDKAYTMAVCGEKLLIGTAGRRIVIWDIRNMTSTNRESILRYQTRYIEAFPNGKGYVVSSIEGRVGVEFMENTPEIQKQKYAFKCHRSQDLTTNLDIIYPVNAISFHPKHGTFATGGGDGYISIWDGQKKKRLIQFHRYTTPISSLSFSSDGSYMAIACSPMDISEDKESQKDDSRSDRIYIRKVYDYEVRPKSD